MSKRKPYTREMKRTWWTEKAFYRFYMVREMTVLPMILFTLFLTVGLGAMVKGPESWQVWLDFMSNPIVLLINIFALLGSLFHAYTFFDMMTSVMPIKLAGKKLDNKLYIGGLWAGVAAVTVFCLAIACYC